MVWRAAVKLAYDGGDFSGFQRQPGLRTVEGEILRALKEIGAIGSAKDGRFGGASRTDSGVSALGNVVAFDTDFRKSEMIRALNAVSEDVYFYGIAEVSSGFSPRRARQRWYRYFLADRDLDFGRVSACASIFEGKHDFRMFCRGDERDTVRTIDSIRVFQVGDFIIADFRAREFLWNMVRRIVAAMLEVGRGRVAVQKVKEALSGADFSFGLAPAECLVLMDVLYDFEFEFECPSTLERRIRLARGRSFVKLAFFDDLVERKGDECQ
ncbi:MAG: tRNA pseudouridine(38-40) synthase TruA [Methanomassiliicoccales archaeon]|nr:tRNA pseudouridine(38-40) synthase TruA [Methanomassiliicoccales archaeon]